MKFDNLRMLIWESQLKAPRSAVEIAKKHNIPPAQADKLINSGAKEELEHTGDIDTAKIISSHHIFGDPEYYAKLKKYVETGK
jgi:hypothetical protein